MSQQTEDVMGVVDDVDVDEDVLDVTYYNDIEPGDGRDMVYGHLSSGMVYDDCDQTVNVVGVPDQARIYDNSSRHECYTLKKRKMPEVDAKTEQWVIVKFLTHCELSCDWSVMRLVRSLKKFYGREALAKTTIHRWFQEFEQFCPDVCLKPRKGGRPSKHATWHDGELFCSNCGAEVLPPGRRVPKEEKLPLYEQPGELDKILEQSKKFHGYDTSRAAQFRIISGDGSTTARQQVKFRRSQASSSGAGEADELTQLPLTATTVRRGRPKLDQAGTSAMSGSRASAMHAAAARNALYQSAHRRARKNPPTKFVIPPGSAQKICKVESESDEQLVCIGYAPVCVRRGAGDQPPFGGHGEDVSSLQTRKNAPKRQLADSELYKDAAPEDDIVDDDFEDGLDPT